MNFMFEFQIYILRREHKIHIFEPTCNVLIIICRSDVLDIAELYFIV